MIRYEDGTVETVKNQPQRIVSYTGGKPYWGSQHAVQIDQFYRAVRGEEALEISADEALKIQKIICEIYRNPVERTCAEQLSGERGDGKRGTGRCWDAYKELTPVVYGENAVKHFYLDFRTPGAVCFAMHWHDRMELLYVVRGSLELHTQEGKFTVREGQTAVSAPRQLHGGFAGPEGGGLPHADVRCGKIPQ